MTAIRTAISQQHATDMLGLTVVPLRSHQLGQLSAASLESTMMAHMVWLSLTGFAF